MKRSRIGRARLQRVVRGVVRRGPTDLDAEEPFEGDPSE
jgi:hypothetical protein